MNSKACNKCRLILEITKYRQCKYPNKKTYYKSICKKCESKRQVEHVRKMGLTDVQKSKMRLYKKRYLLKNAASLNEKYREKIKNNVTFRLRKNVSRQICRVLNNNGSGKFGKSILGFLGYNIHDLRKHLENQFDDHMTWVNYGIYWHIDHIIPQSLLPYTSMEDENFKKCWSLSNLRPLEAGQNMLDGSTRIRHKIYNLFNGETQ